MTLPDLPALEAPLTFEAPTPAAPGMPNPIPPGIAWGQPITPDTRTAPAPTEETP